MECKACGYQKGHEWIDDEYREVNPTGGKFLSGNSSFVYHDNYCNKVKDIYACPECGTLKIDI